MAEGDRFDRLLRRLTENSTRFRDRSDQELNRLNESAARTRASIQDLRAAQENRAFSPDAGLATLSKFITTSPGAAFAAGTLAADVDFASFLNKRIDDAQGAVDRELDIRSLERQESSLALETLQSQTTLDNLPLTTEIGLIDRSLDRAAGITRDAAGNQTQRDVAKIRAQSVTDQLNAKQAVVDQTKADEQAVIDSGNAFGIIQNAVPLLDQSISEIISGGDAFLIPSDEFNNTENASLSSALTQINNTINSATRLDQSQLQAAAVSMGEQDREISNEIKVLEDRLAKITSRDGQIASKGSNKEGLGNTRIRPEALDRMRNEIINKRNALLSIKARLTDFSALDLGEDNLNIILEQAYNAAARGQSGNIQGSKTATQQILGN